MDEVRGILKEQEKEAPAFEPILIYNNGQCANAIEVYKKAFGAEITTITRYSEYNQRVLNIAKNRKIVL